VDRDMRMFRAVCSKLPVHHRPVTTETVFITRIAMVIFVQCRFGTNCTHCGVSCPAAGLCPQQLY